MKRWIVAFLVLACVILAECALLSSGVSFAFPRKSETYQFPNRGEPIESVELLYNPYAGKGYTEKPFAHIRWLNEEEIPAFMERIYNFQTSKYGNPPSSTCGYHVVEVNYKNGDKESFSTWHIEFAEAGSDANLRIGKYLFQDSDAFKALFIEYAGTDDFSEYDLPEETTASTNVKKPEKNKKD